MKLTIIPSPYTTDRSKQVAAYLAWVGQFTYIGTGVDPEPQNLPKPSKRKPKADPWSSI